MSATTLAPKVPGEPSDRLGAGDHLLDRLARDWAPDLEDLHAEPGTSGEQETAPWEETDAFGADPSFPGSTAYYTDPADETDDPEDPADSDPSSDLDPDDGPDGPGDSDPSSDVFGMGFVLGIFTALA